MADLEALDVDELTALIGSADAIVFAAGAGPGSGPQRKWTLDYAGAVKLMEVGRRNGIGRYVIVSSMGADPEAARRRRLRDLPARQGAGGQEARRERPGLHGRRGPAA